MSNGKNRNKGQTQRRRRRSGGGNQGGGGGGNQGGGGHQAPRGPVMTSLGESTYEAVFDHGNEGYGVWFDGVVREDPMYRQFWKGSGNRPIYVKIEEDRMVISKQLPGSEGDDEGDDDASDARDARDDDRDDRDDGRGGVEATSDDLEQRVYSPEEAAQLFVEGSDDGVDDAGEGSDDDAGASTTGRRKVGRRSSAASGDDGDDAKPARRTRARRTRAAASDDDGAGSDGDAGTAEDPGSDE